MNRIEQELVDALVGELNLPYAPDGSLKAFSVIAAATIANNLDRIATALEAFTPQMQPAPEETPEPIKEPVYSSPDCIFRYCPHPALCRAHSRGCTGA